MASVSWPLLILFLSFAQAGSAAPAPVTLRASQLRDGFQHELTASFQSDTLEIESNSNLFFPSVRPIRLGVWKTNSTERLRFFRDYFAAKADREKRRFDPFPPGKGPRSVPHAMRVSINNIDIEEKNLPRIDDFFAALAKSTVVSMKSGIALEPFGEKIRGSMYEHGKLTRSATSSLTSLCQMKGNAHFCRLAEGQAILLR